MLLYIIGNIVSTAELAAMKTLTFLYHVTVLCNGLERSYESGNRKIHFRYAIY